MLDSLINGLFQKIYGKKSFQPLFRKLYSFSLKGLNYGIVGSGETQTMAYVKSKLQGITNPVLFDVGANIGEYTQNLVNVFGPNCQVFAFEPAKLTFEILVKNIKNQNVSLENIGLGSKNEQIKFFSDPNGNTLGSAVNRDIKGIENKVEVVEIQTLDSFCENNQISKIDFLKIDVEGFETEVLLGAKEMLKNNKMNFIQFEFGGTQIPVRIFVKDFFELLNQDFIIYRILADGLELISEYNERLEIFSYSNFLAERR
ncbi:FkbM family methyltransferase [Lacihabitans lacunae]|uniref:FkbM family methyltransferase n=1 Tax=Lacihabitans lacunae TaxID=1028214 RepID=A0ABV7YRS1_9BACT